MDTLLQKHQKYISVAFYLGAIFFWLINLSFSLTSDVSVAIERYQISEYTTRLLLVFIALPVIIIYLAIASAASNFWIYTLRVRNSKEGQAYRSLAWGTLILFLGFISTSMLDSYRTYAYGPTTQLLPIDQVLIYLNILITLGAFYYFSKAGWRLVQTLKQKKTIDTIYKSSVIWTFVIATIYLFLIFSNDYRSVSSDPAVRPLYGMSDLLIILTIAIPNIISWFFGIFAYFNIKHYSNSVKGLIYQSFFKQLSRGLGVVIFMFIGMQLLTQFRGGFKDASLGVILLMITTLLVSFTIGFVLVALATKKLDKIETA